MSKEALKLALKDLERSESALHKARAALREALNASLAEQPAQQCQPGRNHWEDGDVFQRIAASKKQPAQPQQEEGSAEYWASKYPVPLGYELVKKNPAQPAPMIRGDIRDGLVDDEPAQRTWVHATKWRGLTDEERFAIADEYQSSAAAALMVEAKLKEKNT